jgi:hypothetical protein
VLRDTLQKLGEHHGAGPPIAPPTRGQAEKAGAFLEDLGRRTRFWPRGVATRRDFFQTRQGRTYLIGLSEIPIVDIGPHQPRVIAVELMKLDPALVDPDEDMVAELFAEMVELPPPIRAMDGDHEAPGQSGARARWADAIDDFDRSEITERSLREGRRMAYRGVIPRDALSVTDIRSRVVAAFAGQLPHGLDAACAPIPMEGGWRTEVERARSLTVDLSTAVRSLVHAETTIRADDVYAAIDTSDRLRAEARKISREGKLDDGSALSCAAGAIRLLSDFHELPLSDLDTAVQIAQCAARLAQTIMDLPTGGREAARDAAKTALANAESVGPV